MNNMSVISALGAIVGCIILVLSLTGFIAVNAMAQFTEYNNLQPAVVGMISEQMSQQMPDSAQFANMKAALDLICRQGRTAVNFAEVFTGSPNITISCSDVAAAANMQDFINPVATAMFDEIYYKQYACGFIDCLAQAQDQDKIFIIASEHANTFFKSMMMWMVGGMIVGLAIIIISMRKLSGILKAVGIVMIITGAIASVAMNAVVGMLPAEATTGVAAPLVNGVMANLSSGFVIVLVVGIVLAAVGFVGGRLTKGGKSESKKKK